MPGPPTTSSWGFPPETREVQLDEKWSFVAKKQKNRDPLDPAADDCGDAWDFVAYDPEHRLVPAVAPGARTAENTEALVAEAERRLGGGAADLITSDEFAAHPKATEAAFSEPAPAPGKRKPGRPRIPPERRLAAGLNYATVHGHRENDRVAAVERRRVFGTQDGLDEALGRSTASSRVNTSFLERQNGSDRGRDARKARKTYRFSEDRAAHEAMTYLTMCGYNFCWGARALRVKDAKRRWRQRSPAMAAKLTGHVWTWREWLTRPTAQST